MTTAPFELHIEGIFPEQGRHAVICRELLRQIPGKRRVYAALFGDKEVIAKVYQSGFRAKSQVLDEWSKLERLAQKGLNSPKPYFYGTSERGEWAIVVERILNSATALEL